ncbi:MAG: orotate phosphoribosyltransferase [Alphaproteobacteria bacterium]|nr:orotate phosphoribosyltransferase [Alphaproteobacteria bacterium]
MPDIATALAPDPARLADIIRAKSFGMGKIIRLASGRESNFYFNMKPTMLDPEGAALIAAAFVEVIRTERPAFLAGLELGAVPPLCCATMASWWAGVPVTGLIVRKQVKEHGTRLPIEGLPSEEALKDARVLMIEDVTTTGGSVLKAVRTLRDMGAEVAKVLTIVDRQEGAAEELDKEGLELLSVFRAETFLGYKPEL